MSYDQRIKALPPLNIPSFAAEKPDHIDQVGNFRRTQRGLKGRHNPPAFRDSPANLRYAFSLHGDAKIRQLDRQRHSEGTVAPSRWSVTVHTPLRVKGVHSLVAAATPKSRQEQYPNYILSRQRHSLNPYHRMGLLPTSLAAMRG